MSVIAITGRAGSGKDTFAALLAEQIRQLEIEAGFDDSNLEAFKRYRFAGPLKNTVSDLFGWTLDQIEDRVFKETVDPQWGFTPRRAMQLFGTEFGRALDENLWLKFADVAHADALNEGHDGLMITDCRFDNEAQYVRDQAGIVIHVIRPDSMAVGNPEHASEKPVTPADEDIIVYNDGTITQLNEIAREVAKAVVRGFDLFYFEDEDN